MCIYYCIISAFVTDVLTSCKCLYTVVMPPIGMYTDFLLVSNYSMVDVPVVYIQILYYTRNILLLTKQIQEFIFGVTIWLYNMVILNK